MHKYRWTALVKWTNEVAAFRWQPSGDGVHSILFSSSVEHKSTGYIGFACNTIFKDLKMGNQWLDEPNNCYRCVCKFSISFLFFFILLFIASVCVWRGTMWRVSELLQSEPKWAFATASWVCATNDASISIYFLLTAFLALILWVWRLNYSIYDFSYLPFSKTDRSTEIFIAAFFA